MNKTNILTTADIAGQLEALSRQKQTGTVTLRTNENRIARIMILDGDIVNVRLMRERGLEALQTIANASGFKEFKFTEKPNVAIRNQQDSSLPSHTKLMNILRFHNPPTSSPPRRAAQAAPRTAPPRPANQSTTLAASSADMSDVIEAISAELVRYIGPMAPILCKRALRNASTSSDINEGVARLANQLDSEAQKSAFQGRVERKLKELGY